MDLLNKKVLVVGLGMTGVSTARFLKNQGAMVTVTDLAKEDELGDSVETVRKLGIKMELGNHQINTFENADLIVLSPGVPHTIPQIRKAKDKGIAVLGEVELASKFIRRPVIAITGTNGKTTTTTLLGEILKNSGLKVFVGGNIGNPLIGYPDRKENAEMVVAEVSSFQLDTIESFKPKVAVLLNITEDHLDRYPDFKAYADSKARIFENQNAGDTAVLNGSDPLIRKLSKNIKSKKLFFTAREENEEGATINGKSIILFSKNIPAIRKPETVDLSSASIIGKHNIENASAACLAALAAGATLEGIQTAIDNFKGLSHRLEYVDSVNGVKYFNDSKATNIDSVARALEFFSNRVILIMGGRNKGASFHALSDLIQHNTKEIIAIGEAKEDIISSLGHVVPVNTASTVEDAVFKAHGAAKPGDVVLLSPACSSFDMFSSYAHRGEIFCEAVKLLEKGEKEINLQKSS